MMPVYLIHYGQLVQSDITKSINLFSEKTGLSRFWVGAIAFWHSLNRGAIDLYKEGEISEELFIEEINEAIGIEPPLTMDEFKECWNAMSSISTDTLELLKKIQSLQGSRDFYIHVVAISNKMHDEHIQEQLRENNIDLQISYTYSFVEGTVDRDVLLKKAQDIYGVGIVDLTQSEKALINIINDISNFKKDSSYGVDILEEIYVENNSNESVLETSYQNVSKIA